MLQVANLQLSNRVVAIFGKKYGCFSPKIVGRKKSCQNSFSLILRIKKKFFSGSWPLLPLPACLSLDMIYLFPSKAMDIQFVLVNVGIYVQYEFDNYCTPHHQNETVNLHDNKKMIIILLFVIVKLLMFDWAFDYTMVLI